MASLCYFLSVCLVIHNSVLVTVHSSTSGENVQHLEAIAYIGEKIELARKYLYLFHNDVSRTQTESRVKRNKEHKCLACQLITATLYEMVAEQRPEEDMEKVFIAMCIEAKIEDERVCTGFMPAYKDMALAVVRQDILRPDQICGLILGPSCAEPYLPTEMWNVTLPNTPKPPVKPTQPPAPGSPKARFLQLTDVHIDMMYEEGRNALCGEPLCCRSNDAMPAPGVPGAGVWGDYRHCDAPLTLMDNLFKHLAKKSDQFEFILFTGDIAAHDVWNQSRSDQISALERLVSYFEKYLPGKPVYFTAGNHDTAPCNSFPPPFITGNNSQEWMYIPMAENWSKWLPADTKETILRAGYYTVSPYPGFRIISLNNNFCYINNWWLFINTTDPAGELFWLGQTLQQAEDKGEKNFPLISRRPEFTAGGEPTSQIRIRDVVRTVFIIQHHPTDCMMAWSWNFYKIVSRAGYYTVSPYPGFRIISLNNNFCYINNWWLFINTTDPAGELFWLGQTLQQAEDKGEKNFPLISRRPEFTAGGEPTSQIRIRDVVRTVFIIQHHPTDCMMAWSWNFYKIVSRYESTIIGQFNGHTHADEFRVYYDDETLSRPVHMAYVGGSVTPYHGRNPNYRIYTMHGFYTNSSFAVLDYEDYIFNITKNNNLTDPLWELEYSPLETEYGMKGVNPSEWNDLINRMKTDDNLFNKFHLHTSKGGDTRLCTRGCKTKTLCKLKSGKSGDPRLCDDL